MKIREATPEDFEAIWSIFHEIVSAGETYPYPPDTTRPQAYQIWLEQPHKTFVAEENGLAALLGQPVDAFAEIERRLDVERAMGGLGRADGRLCAELSRATADRLAASGHGARSSLYRRVKDLRLALTAMGLQAA